MTLFKVNQRFLDVQNEPQEMLLPIEGYEDTPLLSLKMSVGNLERMISKVIENANIATERSAYPANELSQDESASICLYTMDWKISDRSLCARLNAALRSNDRSEIIPYFFYLKLFLTALCKLKSAKKTVWRGVKADLRNQYPIGKSFIWWGFSSCIESFDDIQSDQFLGKKGLRTVFQIECETGKVINEHSYYHDINEILLLPGIQLQVIDQNYPSNDLCVIHLKEIQSSSSSSPSYLQSPLTSSLTKFSTKQNKNKPHSAPLSSSTRHITNSSCGQRNKSLCTSSLCIPQTETKVTKKTTKSHENKMLKELINKERKKESIRFPKQVLNYDDMEIIADELISNKYWRIIYLWENYINEKHMLILMGGLKLNSTLICLNLDCNTLGDEGASILASILKTNTSLRTVYLNKNQVNDIGAQELASMLYVNRTLTHLELSSNSIGDDGIAAISNALKINNSLRTIYLNDNNITEVGAEYLAHMLQVNKALTDLQLSSNPIGDNGVNVIAHILQQNITLESLHIGQTIITIESMHEIGKMLEMNTMLKSLYLNNNNLGDDALMIIISSLKKNRTLTTLDITMNNLTDKSAHEFACLLKQKQTNLTNLIISQNPLGDMGISFIASALVNNTTLTKLIVESVEMTTEGVDQLSNMLCSNKTLRYLALNNNEIDDNCMNLLVDGLKYNKTLENLYMNNCNLKDKCVPLIIDIMKQNKTLIYIELVKNHLTEQGKMTINEAATLYKTCSIYLDFTFQRVH
ncbi:unnamed protein product [Rotaria sordida]|uniref:NAD(P)(+)--arginine ADP-ribosyltransferase n=1 Tax=Rotaria sordida TaxID=392033 RepID=A0A819HPT4_9BILA|nr:unnamed protein product [Rotaria sordida]CAF3900719.1 unnamed protein product [Rotaria sordida]